MFLNVVPAIVESIVSGRRAAGVLVALLILPLIVPLAAYAQQPQVRHVVVFKYKPGTTPERLPNA